MDLLSQNPRINVLKCHGNLFSRFSQLTNYLKSNRVDCIFSYLTAANAFAALAGKVAGVKSYFPGIRNAYLPPAKAIADRFITNRYATRTVLNCHSGKSYFLTQGFANEKMVVIPNCFENISAYTKKPEDNVTRIITVGRFVAQKDYNTALKVIASLKSNSANIIFTIVGYGELEQEIRAQIKLLNLTEIVEVHINPNNIPELLNRSHIYLSTSLFEGTSNSIMEAMNADLPIVATNVGDNNALIQENLNGFLCDVKDVDAIAGKLQCLITDPDRRAEMGKKSKEHLINEFSMDKFRESYVQLIES
ncbi:glycosyl transferase group 1 [Dyadobacter fermentans DSM 18053]|uniref:Glycosyl transferase group 1 n=2 Tax=Dyadobacter fermentans TaxID=94254 RepID=C6VUL7_DYAFD|nr:glycosyl transferase group 1 [Dyadobacter fermentans DSM 18053]